MSYLRCFGVDAGYGWLKLVGGEGKIKIPSIIGSARSRNLIPDSLECLDDLHIRLSGGDFCREEYFVGGLAKRESLDGCNTLDVEKTDTSRILILTILAIACRDASESNVWLTTGLPIAHYYSQKDVLAQKLAGDFEIEFCSGKLKGKKVKITTSKVNVIPQGAGAVFSQVFDAQGIAYANDVSVGRVDCIDIGYKTTDFIVLDKLNYVDQLSGSLPIGVVDAHKAIMKRLAEKEGRSPILALLA